MKKLILPERWSSRAHMRANEREEKHTCSHHGAIHLSSVAAFTMQAWQLDIDGEEQRQREAKNQIRGGKRTADLMKISKRSQEKKGIRTNRNESKGMKRQGSGQVDLRRQVFSVKNSVNLSQSSLLLPLLLQSQ